MRPKPEIIKHALTDPADVLELLGADIVGMDKEKLVVGVEKVAQLLIILRSKHRTSVASLHLLCAAAAQVVFTNIITNQH